MTDRSDIRNMIIGADAVEVNSYGFVRYFNYETSEDENGDSYISSLDISYEDEGQKWEFYFDEADLDSATYDYDTERWTIEGNDGSYRTELTFFSVLPFTPNQIPED